MARLQPIAGDEQFVTGEEARDHVLVGLQLLEGLLGGGVHVGGILEFDDRERQAIDEDDDVRPLRRLALHHRELIDGEPVVRVNVVEVDKPGLVASNAAIAPRVLDVDAVDEHAMKAVIVLNKARGIRNEYLLERVVDRLRRQLQVDALECRAEPPRKDDFGEVVPLGGQLLRLDVRPVGELVPELAQPGEHGLFHLRLDDP